METSKQIGQMKVTKKTLTIGTQTTRGQQHPAPTESTLRRFENRHQGFKLGSSSAQQQQKRLLWLFDLQQEDRWKAFEMEAKARRWAPATRESYWTSMMALKAVFEEPTKAVDKKILKDLRGTSWSTATGDTPVMTKQHAKQLATLDGSQEEDLATIVLAAWWLGQRIGDMLKLAPEDVKQVSPKLGMLTIRRGKVTSKIGPFTIGFDPNGAEGRMNKLLTLAKRRSTQKFLVLSSLDDFEHQSEKVATLLKRIDPALGRRSIRKGGLIRMANNGMEIKDLLSFSKHVSEHMLMRYLGGGQEATAQLTRQATLNSKE